MMTDNLMQSVCDELNARGFDAKIDVIHKHNEDIQGLTIRIPETAISPVIYPEMIADMYKPGIDIAALTDRVEMQIKGNTPDIDINRINTKEFFINNAALVLCNADWNRDMLNDTPHEIIPGTDLAVYARIKVSDDASFRPTYGLLEGVGFTADEIMAAARANDKTKYTARDMNQVMSEMTGIPAEDMPDNRIIVVSNQECHNGAAAITDPAIMDTACRMLGTTEVYIIPSSTHECLVMPDDGTFDANEIRTMICSVNDTVDMQDRLSDHAYAYSTATRKLTSVQSESQVQTQTSVRGR